MQFWVANLRHSGYQHFKVKTRERKLLLTIRWVISETEWSKFISKCYSIFKMFLITWSLRCWLETRKLSELYDTKKSKCFSHKLQKSSKGLFEVMKKINDVHRFDQEGVWHGKRSMRSRLCPRNVEPEHIFNLVTKPRWSGKPTYKTVYDTLRDTLLDRDKTRLADIRIWYGMFSRSSFVDGILDKGSRVTRKA